MPAGAPPSLVSRRRRWRHPLEGRRRTLHWELKICETGESEILRGRGRELNKSFNGDFNESFGISAWIHDGHVGHKRFVGLERKN